eukprot:TRINITY_DN6131_c0_g1_i2.p1 TRINITY_DN6131_c0_g1~~TRINITY_DN6131_c0_g1_i2.p1  ORF type:complete len:324 (-),score=70.97 TRINITY_DN6131_c0_g1_i2:143-1114(-)
MIGTSYTNSSVTIASDDPQMPFFEDLFRSIYIIKAYPLLNSFPSDFKPPKKSATTTTNTTTTPSEDAKNNNKNDRAISSAGSESDPSSIISTTTSPTTSSSTSTTPTKSYKITGVFKKRTFPFIFNANVHSDITFVLNTEKKSYKFYSHKVILYARCGYFKKMLDNEKESTSDITLDVPIVGIIPEVFYQFLSLLYNDSFKFDDDYNVFFPNTKLDVIDVLVKMFDIAHSYNLPWVVNSTVIQMNSILSTENVVLIYNACAKNQIIYMKYDKQSKMLDTMVQICKHYISYHFDQITSTKAYKNCDKPMRNYLSSLKKDGKWVD